MLSKTGLMLARFFRFLSGLSVCIHLDMNFNFAADFGLLLISAFGKAESANNLTNGQMHATKCFISLLR